MLFRVPKISCIRGKWFPPGDKSISHRALMLGAIAEGETVLRNCPNSGDVESTKRALRALGIQINEQEKDVVIHGVGLGGLQSPKYILDVGNSGTTLRLLTGLLAGQSFSSFITGDASLKQRPMAELIHALRRMGANVSGQDDLTAPITIQSPTQELKVIRYEPITPSAQFKSAVMLAGLFAEGTIEIKEPIPTRDHTERLFKKMGEGSLQGQQIDIPGDFSSAAFLITLAILLPDSSLEIQRVGLNPTRTGFLDIIPKMGGRVKAVMDVEDYEPMGWVQVSPCNLKSTTISGPLTIRAIDEIPLVALLATQADGRTVISGAKTLRGKETDRLRAIRLELNRMGAFVQETKDGLIIDGPTPLIGTQVHSYGDHRIAMMLSIAGMIAKGETVIDSIESIEISFPDFFQTVYSLSQSHAKKEEKKAHHCH